MWASFMARVTVGYLRADCGKGLSALLSVKADEDWYSERGGRRGYRDGATCGIAVTKHWISVLCHLPTRAVVM